MCVYVCMYVYMYDVCMYVGSNISSMDIRHPPTISNLLPIIILINIQLIRNQEGSPLKTWQGTTNRYYNEGGSPLKTLLIEYNEGARPY